MHYLKTWFVVDAMVCSLSLLILNVPSSCNTQNRITPPDNPKLKLHCNHDGSRLAGKVTSYGAIYFPCTHIAT